MHITSCTKRGKGGTLASVLGASALLLGLGFSNNALAAQASGAIQLIADNPNMTVGVDKLVQVRIVNTSTEDLGNGGGDIGAVVVAGGKIVITLACQDSACTQPIPNTLDLNACSGSQTGVTCVQTGENTVEIRFASDVTLPAGLSTTITTMNLEPVTPVTTGTPVGTFFQRGDTGANDIRAFSPIENVFVTGGAQGSRNFLFPPVCSVELDKQISCDGGVTWVDVGYDDNVATACSATDPTLIKVRYLVQNTSGPLSISGCTLTESNTAFGTPTQPGPIGPDGEITIDGSLTPACINAVPGEPNTATVTCTTCQGVTQTTPPITDSDQANLICEPIVGLKVDRNVDCGPAGANNTGGTSDQLLVEDNNDGTNGCRAFDGANVCWEYAAQNTSTRTLYDCTFVDTSDIVGGNGTPYVVGNLAPNQTATVDCNTPDLTRLGQVCSDALEASEAPDNGYLGLTCCTVDVASILDCAVENRVIRNDISTVTCLTPGVNVTADCVDLTNPADGVDDKIRVTVENTGQVDLTSCTVADAIYLSDTTCPPVGPPTPITMVPDEILNLTPGTSANSEGTLPLLTANACNISTVTCTAADGTAFDPINVSTVCEGRRPPEGCLTRTPGFWGTHPDVTDNYLSVEVCGNTIDNVLAGSTTSAIEAVCSVGKDGKILGPQLTQLVRQCTAAALNIAASQELGGNCDNTYPGGIDDTFAACCGGESICTGDGVMGYSVNSCIYALDDFNNWGEYYHMGELDFDYKTGPANPRACQDSKNNGIVVYPQ